MRPPWPARTLARLPLRIKLTLAFTGVMAVLLAAAGIALSLLVAKNLDNTIDDGLSARPGDAAALVGKEGRLERTGETFAQVLSPSGIVRDTTPAAGRTPLLRGAALTAALRGDVFSDLRLPGGARLRLLARPVRRRGGEAIVVV